MEEARVLVAAPIFSGMKYCLKEFLTGMRGLQYENKELLLIDNSSEDGFFDELRREEGITVLRDVSAEREPVKRLVRSRNRILDYALEKGFDFVFMMDSDVVAPTDAISDILDCEQDIVSGLYWNNFRSSGVVKWLPVAWMPITSEEFAIMKTKARFPEGFTHRDLQRHLTAKEAESGDLMEVLYPSAGCLLLSRRAFESVRYGLVPAPQGTFVSDDIAFFKDAKEKGFKLYCDTSVSCAHLVEGKYRRDAAGNLIHPLHPEYEKFSKVL